jgi:hypothetical protein
LWPTVGKILDGGAAIRRSSRGRGGLVVKWAIVQETPPCQKAIYNLSSIERFNTAGSVLQVVRDRSTLIGGGATHRRQCIPSATVCIYRN